MSTLKEVMEKTWNRPGVMFPNHRCWFSSGPEGYIIFQGILHVKAGRPVGQYKSRKKGYSYLSKFYLLAWSATRVPGTLE